MKPSVAVFAWAVPALAASIPSLAPVVNNLALNNIPDNYIVVLKRHVSSHGALNHHSWVYNLLHPSEGESEHLDLRRRSFPLTDKIFEGIRHTFDFTAHGGFLGYSGHFDQSTLDAIRRHPDVEYVERDSVVHTNEVSPATVEKDAPWGLARISHRDSLTFANFNKYVYSSPAGEGVDVYVVDTGTNVDHVDFEGRAKWGATFANDEVGDDDGNGHGTHCSGTIAGTRFGVAKKANVIAVKVLTAEGSGSMSGVIKGVEYVVTSHLKAVEEAKAGKKKNWRGSAANMSLGGGKSISLDMAVNAAVDAGVHFAVAAGNDNRDSCNYSPASAEKAVTVGASTLADERAYFSNFGPCNDIFAPGLNIRSTWIGSKHATNTISGTSMASPHIAGLLAYYIGMQPLPSSGFAVAAISPAEMKANLVNIGTRDALTNVPEDTVNVLAWNGGGKAIYAEIVAEGGMSVKPDQPKQTPQPGSKLPSWLHLPEPVRKLGQRVRGKFRVVVIEVE